MINRPAIVDVAVDVALKNPNVEFPATKVPTDRSDVVAFVNTAVEGVVAPIGVLSIVAPDMILDHVPLVIVPTVARFASVVRDGSDVVAERRLSKRTSVQYRLLDPSASPSVVVEYHDARENLPSSALCRSV